MFRTVLGAAVSKGASVLERLDKHFNDGSDEEEDGSIDDEEEVALPRVCFAIDETLPRRRRATRTTNGTQPFDGAIASSGEWSPTSRQRLRR